MPTKHSIHSSSEALARMTQSQAARFVPPNFFNSETKGPTYHPSTAKESTLHSPFTTPQRQNPAPFLRPFPVPAYPPIATPTSQPQARTSKSSDPSHTHAIPTFILDCPIRFIQRAITAFVIASHHLRSRTEGWGWLF